MNTPSARVRDRILLLSTITALALPWQSTHSASFRDFIQKRADQVQNVLERLDRNSEPAAEDPHEEPVGAPDPTPAYPPAQVHPIQRLLTRLGYEPGPVDGAFGPGTADAIRRYQADHGLPQTGVPSAELQAHLMRTVRSGTAARDTAVATSPAEPAVPAGGRGPSTSTVAPAPAGADAPSAPASGSLVAPAPGAAVPVRASTPDAAPTASTDGAPPSAAAVAAQSAGVPVIRGRPLLVTGGWTGTIEREGIASADEIAAIGHFLDHIRMGLNPDIARASGSGSSPATSSYSGNRALCVANRLLPAPLQSDVLKDEVDPLSGKKQLRAWKGAGGFNNTGANEFEIQRAQQRYNELMPDLVAAAPQLPMKFVFIEPLMLQAYDHHQGGFPFRPPDLTLPRSGCFAIDSDYLPVAEELPSLWALDPQAGEALIRRIPVDTGFPGQQRKVFVAVELTLSGARESPIRGKLEGETLVPIRIAVESVALYEDPDLERHLHTFSVDAPAPAVLLTGLPDRVSMPDPVMLTEEAITLLLLKEQGAVLSEKAWQVLARQQSYSDVLYYKKEQHRRLADSVKVAHLDAYDPRYVPFFPLGKTLSHHQQLDPKQLQAFQAWSLARARALGQRFEVTGSLERERAKQGGFSGNLRLRIGESPSQHRKMTEQLEAAGYAAGRVIRPSLRGPQGSYLDTDFLASPGGARDTYLAMAHPLERLNPAVSKAELESHQPGHSGSWPVIMEVVVTGVELVAMAAGPQTYGNRASEAVLVHLEPRSLEVRSFDGSETLFQQDYDLAALNAEAAATVQRAADAEAAVRAEQDEAAAQRASYRQQLAQADIVGLDLGMTLAEADRVIRERLKIGWIATGAEAPRTGGPSPVRPYREWKTYISADGNEQVVLFAHEAFSDRLVAIARTVALAEGTSVDAVVAAMREKYGEPADDPPPSPGSTRRKLVWTTDLEERHSKRSQIKGCRAEVASGGGARALTVDGRELTFEELRQISTATPIIRVRGGWTLPENTWDAEQWRGCGPSLVAEVGDILPGNRDGLRIAVFNLGEYAGRYQQWLASRKAGTPALPEL